MMTSQDKLGLTVPDMSSTLIVRQQCFTWTGFGVIGLGEAVVSCGTLSVRHLLRISNLLQNRLA